MSEIIDLYPLLFSAIICLAYLLIVSGTKFNIKKSLIIIIPFMILIILFNVVLFEPKGYDSFMNWYILTVFLPEALIVCFISKRKGLSLATGLLNAYLIFYFMLLLYTISNIYNNKIIFSILTYIISIPLAYIFLNFFYNKLHNIVERHIRNAFWLMIIYPIIVLTEIYIYKILINYTDYHVLRFEIFSVAVLSVYIISIAGFYIFLIAYEKKIILDFDNNVLKKQIKNIMELYKIKSINDEKINILRHDLKHVLISLSMLISNNETQKALDLINTYDISIDETRNIKYCNNPMINSILEYYQIQCDQNNIKFNVKINNFDDILNIPIDELVIVISNCLDNAINALSKINSKKYINFSFINNNGRVILQIKNSYDGNINFDKNNLPTSNENNHGFGTKSIKNFAKKYNVTLDYKIKQNTFEINFLFKNIQM